MAIGAKFPGSSRWMVESSSSRSGHGLALSSVESFGCFSVARRHHRRCSRRQRCSRRRLGRGGGRNRECRRSIAWSEHKLSLMKGTAIKTVSLLDEGLHLIEEDIIVVMARFRHRLEQFKVDLVRRNDKRDARDVLLQDISAQVKELEGLKRRDALFERTESDYGKLLKTCKAKGGGGCDLGTTKGRDQEQSR
ncbi:hypothetical protein ACMD2_14156 [Ananas comosus]|uniref:Uncharacterized protein n=1 Tax=Ananas comosus TaxID=4615 RepID=A0A199W7W8_ANACO|nr:hypothetical protein ACMD2_14156 [Ananas comosus]